MEKRLKDISNLINDTCSNKVAMYTNAETAKYTDQAVREAFLDIIGDDKLTYQAWRNHKNEIFTIIEDVLNVNLPLAWEGHSDFYDQFVETKNGALGDKNEFIVEDTTTLISHRFAGNMWSTDRKKLPGRKAFALDTEWFYIHVYDDIERFLKGIVSLTELVAKMQKGMQKGIDDRIFAAFNGAATYLPAQFTVTGSYDRKTMSELISRVETASQKNVVLAGTRAAFSYLIDGTNANLLSDTQKQEIATTGALIILTGLGAKGVLIPQSFIPGTYDFQIANNQILVLPDNEKFIKVYFEGDTRARELGYTDTVDETIDTQVQTKAGVGTVFSSLFGKYTIS